MYEVLRKKLQGERNLFFYIDNCLDLKLGVADKSDLIRHLSQNNHKSFDDLWKDACFYIWEIGHRSKQFTVLMEDYKKAEQYWARFFSE